MYVEVICMVYTIIIFKCNMIFLQEIKNLSCLVDTIGVSYFVKLWVYKNSKRLPNDPLLILKEVDEQSFIFT